MTFVARPVSQQVHPSYAAAFQNAAAVQNASLNPFLGAQTITQLQPTALYSALDQQTVMATAMPATASMPTAVSNANSVPPTSSSNSSQKMLRTDRLEVNISYVAFYLQYKVLSERRQCAGNISVFSTENMQ